MVERGNAEFRDRQIYKLETEDSAFQTILSWFKWSLKWITGGTQKMALNC